MIEVCSSRFLVEHFDSLFAYMKRKQDGGHEIIIGIKKTPLIAAIVTRSKLHLLRLDKE